MPLPLTLGISLLNNKYCFYNRNFLLIQIKKLLDFILFLPIKLKKIIFFIKITILCNNCELSDERLPSRNPTLFGFIKTVALKNQIHFRSKTQTVENASSSATLDQLSSAILSFGW